MRAVTLVELIIALMLLGLLMAGILGVESYARFHLLTSERYSELQNVAAICMERIVKDIKQGVGTIDDPAVPIDIVRTNAPFCNDTELQIRWDSNGNGQVDRTDASTHPLVDGDTLSRYVINTLNDTLEYYPDYGRDTVICEELSDNVINHMVPILPMFTYGQGRVITIRLKMRYNVDYPVDRDNPEIRIITSASSRYETLN